jgi:preprotein translocase subunit SecE
VVLVFVLVVMAFVTVLDLGIGQVTLWVFGD